MSFRSQSVARSAHSSSPVQAGALCRLYAVHSTQLPWRPLFAPPLMLALHTAFLSLCTPSAGWTQAYTLTSTCVPPTLARTGVLGTSDKLSPRSGDGCVSAELARSLNTLMMEGCEGSMTAMARWRAPSTLPPRMLRESSCMSRASKLTVPRLLAHEDYARPSARGCGLSAHRLFLPQGEMRCSTQKCSRRRAWWRWCSRAGLHGVRALRQLDGRPPHPRRAQLAAACRLSLHGRG
mmetsp:Transcript_14416/g.37344  ORF Transcript_14416/g.37344 Transcript_14416/m.37344 type:complete len:236 (-) Transcript_14416:431-1138(-)